MYAKKHTILCMHWNTANEMAKKWQREKKKSLKVIGRENGSAKWLAKYVCVHDMLRDGQRDKCGETLSIIT